jgi:hypothetical protein
MNADVFWEKLLKADNGCWLWNGASTGGKCGGYGELKVSGKVVYAHRYAWLLTHGSLPENLEVAHRCDNRKCCRPDHLFLATHVENMHDMIKKGRHKAGGNKKALSA